MLNFNLDKHRYQRYFVDLHALYDRREIVVYTGLILSLFAIAFFAFFALRPTLLTIISLYKEIQTKEEVNEKLQNKVNALRQAQINYAQVANKVPIVNDALPTDPRLTEIINPLEVLAQRHKLTISNISFRSVDLEGKNPSVQQKSELSLGQAKVIVFDVNLKGEYQDLKLFFGSLEKLRRIITLDAFTFNKNKSEEGPTMSFTLSGKAFYYTVTNFTNLPKEQE